MPRKQLLSKFIKFYYPADFALDPSSIFQSKAFKNTQCFVEVHRANFNAFYNDELQEKSVKLSPMKQ